MNADQVTECVNNMAKLIALEYRTSLSDVYYVNLEEEKRELRGKIYNYAAEVRREEMARVTH